MDDTIVRLPSGINIVPHAYPIPDGAKVVRLEYVDYSEEGEHEPKGQEVGK
jgi:hypothetical protein